MAIILNRIARFSKKQVDSVEMGVELYRQYQYENLNKSGAFNKYASFSQTKNEGGNILSYNEKNNVLHEMMCDEAYAISGLDKERYSLKGAFAFQNFSTAYFSILEEILNRTTAKTEIQQAFDFCEIRSLADGDSLTFHIPSKHLLAISTVANGVRNSHIQKLHGQDITLSPVAKKATVGFDLYKIIAGTVDYGYLINQLTKSFKTKFEQEIINTMFNSFNTLATPFKENVFAQDAYVQLAERVEAANSSPVTVYGTKTALAKILPVNDYMKMELGKEYTDNGYIASPFGVPTVRLMQSVNPNSAYDFSIPNNYLLFLSSAEKVVKAAIEGETTIRQTSQFETADDISAYTITQKWDIQIACHASFGVLKTV